MGIFLSIPASLPRHGQYSKSCVREVKCQMSNCMALRHTIIELPKGLGENRVDLLPRLLGRFVGFFVVLHHEATIAFPAVLLYGFFCFNKEALLPVSITPMQFTRHND